MTLLYLQAIAAVMGLIYNCLIAYEHRGVSLKFAGTLLSMVLLGYVAYERISAILSH